MAHVLTSTWYGINMSLHWVSILWLQLLWLPLTASAIQSTVALLLHMSAVLYDNGVQYLLLLGYCIAAEKPK